ncbi:thermonuclease family protein [Cytobacillus pseudoceanisediminis]|uniref:thermonuclease family protein n=1 Tax=Cytobacillus pseudoceanisediminis TaxID=3051614 RepID=UPI003C2D1EC4
MKLEMIVLASNQIIFEERRQLLLKIGRLTLLLSVLILTSCQNSSMVSDFERTRNYFNDRMGLGSSKAKEKLNEWYSWQLKVNETDYKAPDGVRLQKAIVKRVIDGDTIEIEIQDGKKKGLKEKIRLILINSPESTGEYEQNPEPYALEAFEFTKSLLSERTVLIEMGVEKRDQYGRLLAYVWLDQVVFNKEIGEKDSKMVSMGEFIGMVTLNELLLREGMAQVAIYPPNTKYEKEFSGTQAFARKQSKGLWED